MAKFGTNIRVKRETYLYLEEQNREDESFDDTLRREIGAEELKGDDDEW